MAVVKTPVLTQAEVRQKWVPAFQEVIDQFVTKHKLEDMGVHVSWTANGEMTFKARTVLTKAFRSGEKTTKDITQDQIDLGLAPPGTLVWANADGVWYLAKVLQARRSRYLFSFLDSLDEKWLTKFSALKIRHPKTGKPPIE